MIEDDRDAGFMPEDSKGKLERNGTWNIVRDVHFWSS